MVRLIGTWYSGTQFWNEVSNHTSRVLQFGVFGRSRTNSFLGGDDFCLVGWKPVLSYINTNSTAVYGCIEISPEVCRIVCSTRAWSRNLKTSTSNFHLWRGRLIPFFVGTLLSCFASHSLISILNCLLHCVPCTYLSFPSSILQRVAISSDCDLNEVNLRMSCLKYAEISLVEIWRNALQTYVSSSD